MDAAWNDLGATSYQRTGGLLGDEMSIQVKISIPSFSK